MIKRRILVVEDEADIADLDVLADIAEAVGLSRQEFLSALDDPGYIAQVDQDISLAQSYGLGSVPALVFEDQYLVSGA